MRRAPTFVLACLASLAAPLFAFGAGGRVAQAQGPAPASAAHVSLPNSPASVAGLGDEASVSVFSGQLSYGVPMSLPAGRGGFGPSLGLGYSGELGNGSVGIGWRLSYAAIRRSTREGVPAFTDADELELAGLGGGGRLIRVPGDGTYRLEGAGNALRIERMGQRFVVTDADGTKYYFGLTEASRQHDGAGRVFAWRPELVAHRSGEYAEYRYRRDGNRLYLSRIEWGPSVGMPAARKFDVELAYQTRPDPVESFREGFRVTTALRLATVTVHSEGIELSAYHLTYEPHDESMPLSRLASVHMTGFEGRDALPTLQFSYAGLQRPTVTPMAGIGGWTLEQRGTAFFDIDGDGADDLYRLEMGNHEWRKNLGDGFGARAPIDGAVAVELQNAGFLDLDGDARPELVRIVDDTWRYSRIVSDGAGGAHWETAGMWPGTQGVPLRGPGVALADIDGDGRTDVLEAVTSGVRVRFNGAEGLAPPIVQPPISAADPYVEIGQANVRVIDFNGDGLADIA